MLGWDQYGFDKNALGYVTSNLCFYLPSDLRVT
jgi:hypothetical protein